MPKTTGEKKPVSKSETGHAKFIESIERWIAADATLDPLRLDAPADLQSAALAALLPTANAKQQKIGDSKATWRTVALNRQVDVDQLESKGAAAVALLESRGASAEKVKAGRALVKKLRGGGKKTETKADDPTTPDIDESEKGISKSQQSSAAQILTFFELIDFLEAQPEYVSVKNPGLTIADLRAFNNATQTKHTASIGAATALSVDRASRNGFFYTDDASVINLARRYKKLVQGAYGPKSPEYALVNAIPFQKPRS